MAENHGIYTKHGINTMLNQDETIVVGRTFLFSEIKTKNPEELVFILILFKNISSIFAVKILPGFTLWKKKPPRSCLMNL